jgi:S1-C subfamily serine protease
MELVPGGPAAKAGLRATRRDDDGQLQLGDLIVAIDGHKVDSVNQLLDNLEKHQMGSTVEVRIRRDGEEKKVSVTLEALP